MPEPAKIVVAGSRQLPPGIPEVLVDFFDLGVSNKDTILLRRGTSTGPGRFERDISRFCHELSITVEWRTSGEGGREAVFERDFQMVRDSDLVLAFMTPEQVGDDNSGTYGLVDKALYEHRPVYAYGVSEDGVELIGSDDPHARWAKVVPQP